MTLPVLCGQPVEQFVDDLLRWFEMSGASRYDDAVSQLQHALQTAHLASRAMDTDASVAAALLHDVGHLLLSEHDGQTHFLSKDLEHEIIGADWLAQWFPAAVTEPVRGHVQAKRFLCAVDDEYHARLSKASVRSLELQGGPLSHGELEAFESRPYFEAAVALRRRDEGGKAPNRPVPGLAEYRDLLISQVTTR